MPTATATARMPKGNGRTGRRTGIASCTSHAQCCGSGVSSSGFSLLGLGRCSGLPRVGVCPDIAREDDRAARTSASTLATSASYPIREALDLLGRPLRIRHAHASSARPIKATRPPISAHCPWPLIPDPCTTSVPWAIHSAPMRHNKTPAIPRLHTIGSDSSAVSAHWLQVHCVPELLRQTRDGA